MKRMMIFGFAGLFCAALLAFHAGAQDAPAALTAPEIEQARQAFNSNCSTCHGEGAGGGDRAPSLVDNSHLRTLDSDGIAAIIKNGQGGMPAFASLPQADLTRIARWLHGQNISALSAAAPEQIAAGENYFFGAGGCSGCHMVRGRGASNGPDLSTIGARSTRDDMGKWLDNPTAAMAGKALSNCPGPVCSDFQGAIQDVTLKNGTRLKGFARNRSEHDLALQTLDGKFHMIPVPEIASMAQERQSYMPAPNLTPDQRRDLLAYLSSLGGINAGPVTASLPPVPQADIDAVMAPRVGDWTTYYGQYSGNRYSPLKQINAQNVKQLQPQWLFTPGGTGLQGTPIVMGGIMYVTGGPQTCALDARTGLRIWCTPRTNGLGAPAAGGRGGQRPAAGAPPPPVGPNRGVAILGDRLYYTSDDAYIVCLNRLTGAVMWTEPLAEKGAEGKFYTSAAPLVVGDLVITGVAGGDSPVRGFLVAYHANSGVEAWRLYTIPKPGEPLSETWTGRALPTGGGATWVTGSYDAETQTLFWAVGNPYPDTDPDERAGTNLYTNSVLALDAKTGKIKWYFQFTPYDTHDWDATEPMVLVDTMWRGKPRKLLMTAQRSGVFYVLDRTNGQFLLAKPFVKKLSWVSGFRPDGSPILIPGNTPSQDGTKSCPPVRGATNWYSSSYNPATKLFYVMAAEDCGLYRKSGRIYGANPDPSDPGTRQVRALNIETGERVWDKPMVGPQESNYTGILSTAGGLLFHGETGGAFAAVDTKTGKTLYTFRSNAPWRASPMTYMVDGRQYVAGMDGTNLIVFALGHE